MEEEEPPWGASPLDRAISDMWKFDSSRAYYALTLAANRQGVPYWSVMSKWIGWSERNPQWEIRDARPVDPDIMTKNWSRGGRNWVSVHDELQLSLFMYIGGNVLAEKEFADQHLAEEVGPQECAPDRAFGWRGRGFIVTGDLDDDCVERRVPSRKVRGQVLKRDGYRCVMCGRRPRDHVDLELHLHHVIPWRMGGPTAEFNLVTLCGTCHKGLDPDYEPRIRELANLPGRSAQHGNAEHQEEIQRYRETVKRLFGEE